MRCQACGHKRTRVIETRGRNRAIVVHRIRLCPNCENVFHTWETTTNPLKPHNELRRVLQT